MTLAALEANSVRFASRAIQLVRWKEEVYEEKERGFSILVVVYVVFVCFSLCFFFFVCLFHSLAMTYKNGRLRDVYEDAVGRICLSGFATKSSFASFSHQCSFNVFVSLFPSLSLTFRSNND